MNVTEENKNLFKKTVICAIKLYKDFDLSNMLIYTIK